MDAFIGILICGALGGAVTALSWKIEHQSEKVDWYKVARNLILGAMSAVGALTVIGELQIALTPALAFSAFTAGLSGEFILQKAGKAVAKT
jgi:hypothetical protein